MSPPESPRDRTFQVGDCRILVTSRSLADLGTHVDALVSSDDNYLTHGGGVSKALWLAAGEEEVGKSLETQAGKWSLGDVVVSAAGRLQAQVILHAVTIDFDSNRRISPPELGATYARIFATAADQGFLSVGLPLVASGAGGITPHVSATSLVRSIFDVLASPIAISMIVVAAPGKGFSVAAEAFEPLRTWDSSFGHLWTEASRLLQYNRHLPQALRLAIEGLFEEARSSEWPVRVAIVLDQASEFLGQQAEGSSRWNQARSVRNSLLHGSTQPKWTAEVNRALLDMLRLLDEKTRVAASHDAIIAAEESFSWLGMETMRLNRQVARHASGPLFDEQLAISASIVENKIEPVAAVKAALESETPGEASSHVRKLHHLMLDRLMRDVRLKSSVDRQLGGLGYQGEFELRLLEHCIRLDDPSELLTGTFDRPTLQEIYADCVGESAPPAWPSAQIVSEILYAIGFPRLQECHGPKQVRETIDRSEQLIRVKGVSEASAVVQDVARRLEYLCHLLLRFISKAAFGESPEMYLTRRKLIKQPGDLTRAGLGSLLVFCEQIIDDLRTTDAPQAQTLQRDLGDGALVPKGRDALSSVRNAFSHFKPGAPAGSDADALGFLREARRFTDALASAEGRLLPYVISVQSIHLDRWGRRTVKALNDDGMEETIFTDEPLRPGELYLMYPLSNPLRVDPILVPAGDVIWKD